MTLFPEMFEAITRYGITGRAFKKGLINLSCFNPRDYTSDKHQTVDDRPYGGGPGMVMMVDPLVKAVDDAKRCLHSDQPKVIYLSPQGKRVDQSMIKDLAECDSVIFVAGRYEGVDERFIEAVVDEEWSIGDYVLSGGELPAMVVLDAVTRMLPSSLGDDESAEQDSFMNGLLDCPHYTRPEEYNGASVPAVLLSGDHGKIAKWRAKQSFDRTKARRPDLLEDLELSKEQKALLKSDD